MTRERESMAIGAVKSHGSLATLPSSASASNRITGTEIYQPLTHRYVYTNVIKQNNKENKHFP